MTMIDIGCWERGCACYDSRIKDETVEVVRREWVGLTDDEFKQIMLATYNIDLNVSGHSSDDYLLWNAIEAKLKEKNT